MARDVVYTFTATDSGGHVRQVTHTVTVESTSDAPPANADNTGPRVSSFTASTASVFASGGTATNPLVVSGRSFAGDVEVLASHLIIRDCKFSSGLGIASNDNVTVEYCEIRNGMYLASSWNTTVRNTEIYGSGDLLHITSDRTVNGVRRMVKNAVVDTVWAHSDSTASQLPDHVDGMQIRGLEGLTVRNSVFDLGAFQDSDNAAYFTQPSNGGHWDIRVDNSWFRGGYCSFRYEGTTGGYFEVTNCCFPYSPLSAPQYNPKQGSSPTLQSGNKYQKQDGSWAPLTLL
jgi:hypothetical protein